MSCLEKNGATLSLTSSITTNFSLFPCHTLQCLQPSRQNPPSKWLANEQVVYKYLNHIANMPEMSVARGACNYAALIKSLNAAQKQDGRRAWQIMLQCPTGPTVCFLYRLWAVVLQPQKIVKARVRLRKQASWKHRSWQHGFHKDHFWVITGVPRNKEIDSKQNMHGGHFLSNPRSQSKRNKDHPAIEMDETHTIRYVHRSAANKRLQ